jgi:signal transduction histidine kinase
LDWLGKLQAASSHMASLVNHVLEFTRLDADGFELSRVPVNVHALAEKVQRRWLPQACARSQQISLDIEPLADPLSGDAQLLEKALDHYVHNAIKFADEGMIVISVRLLERDMNSVLLKFAVSDAGPGLDSAVVQRLFNAFALQDETTTRVQGGVGLGLVTVRKLARLMGGDAGCDSQAGQGSAFWFTVRLHRA